MSCAQNYIPVTKSKEQIRWLYHSVGSRAHLFYRLKAIVFSKLYGKRHLQHKLWDYVVHLVEQNFDDETIYINMFIYYHWEILVELNKETGTTTTTRPLIRMNELSHIFQQLVYVPNETSCYLDLGCNDRSITNSVAEMFHLSPQQAHGCDVIVVAADSSSLSTFSQCTEDRLPYQDNQFDLVTAFMSLHHMTHQEEMMLEINRVTKASSLMIIREHDVSDLLTAPLLDVVHGFHSQVWHKSGNQECTFFCRDYFAHYRSRHEWRRLFERFGWSYVLDVVPDYYPWDSDSSYVKNPQRIIFQVYRKQIT